jgi:hypothetical protein
MEYRQGDVRDESALEEAFADADVVVHLAFMITGTADARPPARSTSTAPERFRAAAAAGRAALRLRLVASRPTASTRTTRCRWDESWPTRPAANLFYAQEKAELERLLGDESGAHPEMALYLLRPPVVLGPNFVGGKEILPGPRSRRWVARSPTR